MSQMHRAWAIHLLVAILGLCAVSVHSIGNPTQCATQTPAFLGASQNQLESQPVPADGFTLTIDTAISYFQKEHVSVTLTVPSGGDNWFAVELIAIGATRVQSGSNINQAGTWQTTATELAGSVSLPMRNLCNETNQYRLVSGASQVTYTGSGFTTTRFTWIAPNTAAYGSIHFSASVAIDASDYFVVNSASIPFLAAGQGCVNPKTGNTTWSPYPICNGHGKCLATNNTCMCNGTYTGPGCYVNTACGPGQQGKPSHCSACPSGTFKSVFGTTNTSTSYDTTVCRPCSDNIGLPYLGVAGKYALLVGAGFTFDISIGSFTPIFIAGDIGVVSGAIPSPAAFNQVSGITHTADDADSTLAGAELTNVINGALYTLCTYMPKANLSSVTLKPGNYCWHTSMFMHGKVTLDAQGDPQALWLFIVKAGTLTIGIQPFTPADDITLINGAQESRVFWISASGAATVISSSTLDGNLIASGLITLGNGAHVTGSVLTLNNVEFKNTATIGDLAVPQIYANSSRFASPSASISWLNCTVTGTVCAAGRYYSAGNCPFCAAGTYKSSTGDQECSLCDAQHTTPTTGATSAAQCSVKMCAPGHYGDPTGLHCKNCPLATYKTAYGPQACTACPVGLNTTTINGTNIHACNVVEPCPVGYFGVAVSATSGCTPCGLGTYNNKTGQTAGCHLCPEGRYSTVLGATSITQCTTVQPNPPGQDLCSQFHFKEDLCNRFSTEGCVFNVTTGNCVTEECCFFQDKIACNLVRKCRWYSSGEYVTHMQGSDAACYDYVPSSSTAFSVCDAIDGGYVTTYTSPAAMAAACLAEPMCEWLCDINHCVVDRNIIATTPDVNFTTCIQDGIATWVQNVAQCVDFANGNHVFAGFTDPAFSNFTCPPGVCIPRGRYNEALLCHHIDSTACATDGGCVWNPYLARCMATENRLPFNIQCDYCQNRTAHTANYWNVQVPDLGAQLCANTPGCVINTDCALKPHCKVRDQVCIRDDLYMCPLLPTQYACVDSPGLGAGLCALYNATGVCNSALHPPVGWPAFGGFIQSDSSYSYGASELSYSYAWVNTQNNFEIDLGDFSYNPTTSVFTFDLTTPLNWNLETKESVIVKIGYGGYPGLGYNFGLSTITGVSTAGQRQALFARFVDYVHLHHNFPIVCNTSSVDLRCTSMQHQNVYTPLNLYPTGIATGVDVLHDPTHGPELQFSLSLNLLSLITTGVNAGVVTTFTQGAIQDLEHTTNGVPSSMTDMTIPITTVWRGVDGQQFATNVLKVAINAAGEADVIFTTQRGYFVTLSILDTSFSSDGCTAGKVSEVTVASISYRSADPNKLFLGPQHIDDITTLANCYQATLSNFVAPTCAAGVCRSQVTITTQCRTPTLNGDTFLTCPSGYDATFRGRFRLQITPWFCQHTGQRLQTSCSGQTLLQQTITDTATINVRLPTDNTTLNQQNAELAFTAGILPNVTSPLSAITQADNNGIVSAADRFIPLVAYMTASESLDTYTMAIVTKATVFTFKDSSGHVIAAPTLYFLMTNGAVHVDPNAWAGVGSTNPVVACAAHTGCDQVVLDGFGLIALYPTIDSATIDLVVEAAFNGVAIPASRRLLSVPTFRVAAALSSSSSDSSVTETVVTSGTNFTIHFERSVFTGHPVKSSPRLTDGAIAGIVIGVFFFVVIVVGIIVAVVMCTPQNTRSRGTYGEVSGRSELSSTTNIAAERRKHAMRT